jgi:hypothetical protein
MKCKECRGENITTNQLQLSLSSRKKSIITMAKPSKRACLNKQKKEARRRGVSFASISKTNVSSPPSDPVDV